MTATASQSGTITVALPDGSTKSFTDIPTGFDVASSIGAGLAKAALAIEVDGKLWDLSRKITSDCNIRIITARDPEALDIIRHDAAHVLAEAVQELFPDAHATIGPVIENGFYYDFARKDPFSSDDLEAIEQRMREIVDRDETINREVWNRDDAIEFYRNRGDKYKVEIIESLPEDEVITLYRQGNFIDLCRGPHLPSTKKLGKAFKLMKVAGAYWRGDSNNEMLQRIYGTAWASEKELKQYLRMLEEADKRDHRKLGKALDLFHFQEEAAGIVFWHDKGWTVYREVQNYIRSRLRKAGYQEVNTPMLVDRMLWEKSGHWSKFREHMFTTLADEDKTLALKPMNCPCHVQIFKQGTKSYRDLPLRMAEFGTCHRNEPSGALHGLMRVRGFTQDDAHIFCTEEQITSETVQFCKLLLSVYEDFGFTDVRVKFSDRPQIRAGDDSVWDKAENSLREAIEATGLEWTLNPGEGAFYGPKLEFILRDALGRDWQCGTLQVDFVLPERLDASYIGADGDKHRPVMLHRAILGSMERFIGILIEEFAGKFPLWLAPVQAVVTTVTNDSDEYAMAVYNELIAAGLRCELDISTNKINYKIREHSNRKIPFILAVGNKEQRDNTVSIRQLGQNKQIVKTLTEAVSMLCEQARAPI